MKILYKIMKIFKISEENEFPLYCAWCKKHIRGLKPGYDTPKVSHGICEECSKIVHEKLDGIIPDEE
jgi:hypothetical protein